MSLSGCRGLAEPLPTSPGPGSAATPLKFPGLHSRERPPSRCERLTYSLRPAVHRPQHCGQDEKQRPCRQGDRPDAPSPDPPRARREGRRLHSPDPGPRPILSGRLPDQRHRRRLAVERCDAHAGPNHGRSARRSTRSDATCPVAGTWTADTRSRSRAGTVRAVVLPFSRAPTWPGVDWRRYLMRLVSFSHLGPTEAGPLLASAKSVPVHARPTSRGQNTQFDREN